MDCCANENLLFNESQNKTEINYLFINYYLFSWKIEFVPILTTKNIDLDNI